MQYASGSCREYTHEKRGNSVTDDENDNEGRDRLTQLDVNILPVVHDKVADNCAASANAQFAKEVENATDTFCERKCGRVLQKKQESVDSGHAEVLTCEHNLAVGILVHILNEPVATV